MHALFILAVLCLPKEKTIKIPCLCLLFLLILSTQKRQAQAAIYSLQDQPSSTSLFDTDGKLLAWWEGGPAFALASSSAVRINFRGLYTYPPKAIVRDLPSLGWHGVACNASAWALCASSVGQAFPFASPRMPENPRLVTADGWNDLGCAKSRLKTLVSQGVYDLTACDVFDEGLDTVFANSTLFHRHNTMEVWEYWLLVVLSIVLVRFFSYNIQLLWLPTIQGKKKQEVKPQWQALLCCCAIILLILPRLDRHFVTSADLVFFWSNVAYVLIYLAIHGQHVLLKSGGEDGIPVYNIIIATLQLVACRFYASAETPYNLVLMGILATRVW